MTLDSPVVLDSCVLVQAPVRDILLRLYERGLFSGRWSDEIMEEVRRALITKIGRSAEQADYLVRELREHFPDAWVDPEYRGLIPEMTNDAKDRHVLAAAVQAGCEVIVTYNLRHFPRKVLKPWGVTAMHPDEFLIDLYSADHAVVAAELQKQGQSLRVARTVEQILNALEICQCKQFAELIRKRD